MKTRWLAVMALLIVALASTMTWATDYYVDYAGGNDTNSGTNLAAAWKHAPGDTAAIGNAGLVKLQAGDMVIFKKGIIYRGQIMTKRNGAEVANGANGAVTAGGVFTSSGQHFLTTVTAGDMVYIYNGSMTGAWVGSVGLFSIQSVDSDTQLTLSNFAKLPHAAAEMTYRIWRPITYTSTSAWGTGDAIISGHDDDDIPTWYYLVKTAADYIRFANLKFQDTKYPDGYPGSACSNGIYSALWGNSGNNRGLIVDNCNFERCWRISNTSYIQFVVLINNKADNTGACGYENNGSYGLLECNTIDNSGGGIRSVGSYVVLRGNIITNANKLPGEICDFHSDGIMAHSGSAYGWIMDNYMFNTIEGIYLSYTNGGTSHFTIINNVLIGNYDAAGGTGDYAIYANCAPYTRIYNNTIFGLPGMRGWLKGIGIGAMDGSTAPSPNCEVKNNLIYVPNGEHTWIGTVDASSTAGFVSDYNIIYIPNETNGKPFKINNVDKTWAEWQAAGYDVHGSISEPGLVKTSGAVCTDFDLRLTASDAVARDMGTTGLWACDINHISRPQGGAWDIGAYEYIPGLFLNAPTGGEIWVRGFSHDIAWSSSGVTEPIKIELFNHNILQWDVTVPAADSSYAWPIPANQMPGNGYAVKISSGSYADISDSFTIAVPSSPAVQTLAAQSVTASAASLRGTIHPMGLATTYYFEYGLTAAYGSATADVALAAGAATTSVQVALTGLNASTTYHYRIVATNSKGTTEGNDLIFTTSGGGGGGGSGNSGGGGGCFISSLRGPCFWFMVLGLAPCLLVWTTRRAKSTEKI